MIGNIPTKLKLFVCNPREITLNYEDLDIAIGKPKMVSETFVSDADNPKTCRTGEEWAKNNGQWDNKGRKFKHFGYTIEELNNDSIQNVVVTSLEHRGNGGRAYKVIVNGKYYVDLREDILLDTILNAGIDIGGKLKGEFIWGKVGSAMKLIRVGSPLHEELIKSTEMSTMNKIKNLEVGRIYESKKEKLLYLGNYETTVFELDKCWPTQKNYYNPRPKSDGTLLHKKERGMLFLEIHDYDHDKPNFNARYNYKLTKSHSLKIDTGKTVTVPENFLAKMKEDIIKDMTKYSLDPEIKELKYGEIYYLTQYSRLLNLGGMHPLFQKALTL